MLSNYRGQKFAYAIQIRMPELYRNTHVIAFMCTWSHTQFSFSSRLQHFLVSPELNSTEDDENTRMGVKDLNFPGKIFRTFCTSRRQVIRVAESFRRGAVNRPNGVLGQSPWKLELYSSLPGSKQTLKAEKRSAQPHKNTSTT